MDDRDSNVEILAGVALGAGRLYVGFWKWLLRIMIVVFGLIAVAIWADKTRDPGRAASHRLQAGLDLSLRYYQPK